MDADLRVGGVQETITVTGETPVVDVTSTTREITLDNETMRSLPGPRSYSYLLTTVPGLQTNVNNVSTGPVFAIFPIHGGRGVESRLTVEGLNISNPPGGNQPPNYTADIGNAQEVTMTTSGGLGEIGDGRPDDEHRPEAGRQPLLGPVLTSPASRRGCSRTTSPPSCRRAAPRSRRRCTRVYDVNTAVGGPIVRDRLWYYMSVRVQGQRQNTLNVYYNQNAGNPNAWTYVPDLEPAGLFGSHLGELHAAHHLAGDAAQQVLVLVGRTAGLPHVHRHDLAHRLAELHLPDLARGGRPRRVQPAARPDGALDVAGDQQAAARSRRSAPPTTSGAAASSTRTRRRIWCRWSNISQTIAPGVVTSMRYRSQNWLNNRTRGSNWIGDGLVRDRFAQREVRLPGQPLAGRPRDAHQHPEPAVHVRLRRRPAVPSLSTRAPYNVNARAMQTSLYAQDQWTLNRLTLQGAIR